MHFPADPALDVGTGAEGLVARPGDDRHAHGRIVAHADPGIRQALVVFRIERVALLRAVDGDQRDSIGIEVEVGGAVIFQLNVERFERLMGAPA